MLATLDVPCLSAQPVEFQTLEQWGDSERGLMPVENTIMVAIPELDGTTGPMVFGGRTSASGAKCAGCHRGCSFPTSDQGRDMHPCIERAEMLEGFPLRELQLNSAAYIHVLAETMKHAYADRSRHLGDPDFHQVPVAALTSPEYARTIRAAIDPQRATPSQQILPATEFPHESTETTHYSVVDADGNMVSNTYTLNFSFGSGIAVPGGGFFLNNEMDDFAVAPGVKNAFGLTGDEANAVAAGKRPLSSMSPTILLGSERVAAIGSPGGSRIITMVFQGLSLILDGKSASEAVAAPRVHHQYQPDSVSTEPGALSEAEMAALTARGYTLTPAERPWGNMQIVVWNRSTGAVEAASDPRWKTVGGGESRDREAIYR